MGERRLTSKGELLYSTLGVPKTATADEIKHAYRRLALRHHPDKNPHNPEAATRFMEVNHAYNVLSDSKLRNIYDNLGSMGIYLAEEFEKKNIDPGVLVWSKKCKCVAIFCGIVTCFYCCCCCCCCCNCCCGKCIPVAVRQQEAQQQGSPTTADQTFQQGGLHQPYQNSREGVNVVITQQPTRTRQGH